MPYILILWSHHQINLFYVEKDSLLDQTLARPQIWPIETAPAQNKLFHLFSPLRDQTNDSKPRPPGDSGYP